MSQKAFQVFSITIPASQSRQILFQGSYFKLLSASGILDVTIEGQGTLPNLTAGRGLKDTAYSRLILTDKTGASNIVELFCATEEYVDQTFSGIVALDAATLAALESVDLNTATIKALATPLINTGHWNNSSTIAANTPLTVFAPGANLNGAIILSMTSSDGSTSSMSQAFVAKSSAPTSVNDGEVLASSVVQSRSDGGGVNWCNIEREYPTRIAAGLGLYFIASAAGTAGWLRSCRYILL